MLIDKFGREHNYLRISLTDACNFRCQYCIPHENVTFTPSEKLMQADEIFTLAEKFVTLGVNKIRITGGEPMMRKDFEPILKSLASLPVKLHITTNGYFIDKYLELLKNCGINSINLSLDSLQKEVFYNLTQRNAFDTVWKNITLLLQENFKVKLNVVLMKGINDGEINDFIRLTKKQNVHIRFIEFMPFDKNHWTEQKVMPMQKILERVSQEFEIEKLADKVNDTSKKYKVKNHQGSFAIISTMTQPFCGGCNRLRLTADGKFKNCLFSQTEADLLSSLRSGKPIEEIIIQHLNLKKEKLGGQFEQNLTSAEAEKIQNRSMIAIGG